MRNIILVSLAGLLLTGCLTPEKSTMDVANNVAGDNNAPTISGQPPSATKFGESYQFQPTASDPDGDPLTFSVQNKPLWTSFDTATGRLRGQPMLADVGVYRNIVVSVSDGTDSSSLPEFAITVSQTALGNVTLRWDAPNENMDGSPLTNLAGYKIYFGNNPGLYDRAVQIDNPSVTIYVLEELTSATYYFVATAFNTSGVESSFSSEVVWSIQ